MTDNSFPQHGDQPDAANFAQAHGTATLNSYIVSGLDLTNPDYTTPTIDVTSGVAVLQRGDYDTADPDIDPSETRSEAAITVEKDAVSAKPLTDGTVNHVYLDPNLGSTDAPLIKTNTTGTPPNSESLKIGEVDTSNDTLSSQWNLITEDGTPTFPDIDAVDAAATNFTPGTVLFNRGDSEHYEVL